MEGKSSTGGNGPNISKIPSSSSSLQEFHHNQNKAHMSKRETDNFCMENGKAEPFHFLFYMLMFDLKKTEQEMYQFT